MSINQPNQHIENYLTEFQKMEDVDFAVMITGPWGCGKTHFIKKYLKDRCTLSGENEYIYVSLNGLSKTTDIDMALFQAAHPVLGSKLAVTTGKIFKASLKAGLKIDLDVNQDGNSDGSVKLNLLFDSFKLDSKSKLLVFDDLERCLLKPEEVLGYINAFVESQETKVIIVGDEDLVGSDSQENSDKPPDHESNTSLEKKAASNKYLMIKEKVVGKTFRLNEAVEVIFSDLIIEPIYPKTFAIIQRNRAHIIRIFQKVSDDTGKHNYRALKHCLRDFEYFYLQLTKKFQNHEQLLDDLLNIFVTLGYELQLGHYPVAELEDGQNILSQEMINAMRGNGERTKEKLEIVCYRHGFSWSWCPTLGWKLWYKILGNQNIETSELTESLGNSSYFTADQAEWVTLWHWLELDDITAKETLAKVNEKIAKREYQKPEIIVHVFGILLMLSHKGVIPETKKEVISQLKEYLHEPIEVANCLDQPHLDRDSFGGLGYASVNYPEFNNQLMELVGDALTAAIISARKERVSEWIEKMQNDPIAFSNMIKDHFPREPVFELFSPKDFASAYDGMTNSNRWIIAKLIKNRYSDSGPEVFVERKFVEGVIDDLSQKISNHKGTVTPSIANTKDLLAELEKAKQNIASFESS